MTPLEPPWGDKAGYGCVVAILTGVVFWVAVYVVYAWWGPP